MKLKISTIFTFLSIILISKSTFGMNIKIQPITIAKDQEEFYALLDDVVYIDDFNMFQSDLKKYSTKISKRILKVPTKDLEIRLGIKEGQSIGIVDLKREKTYKYVVKDHVYALYFEQPMTSDFSNTTLILNDDPKVHESLAREVLKRPDVTGFAYKGTKRKVIHLSVEWLPLKDVPKDHSLYNGNIFVEKPPVIKKSKVYNYELIAYQSSASNNTYDKRFTFFFKNASGVYEGFRRDTYDINEDRQLIKVFNAFEGTKIFRMFDGDSVKQHLFVLCTPESLELLSFGPYSNYK